MERKIKYNGLWTPEYIAVMALFHKQTIQNVEVLLKSWAHDIVCENNHSVEFAEWISNNGYIRYYGDHVPNGMHCWTHQYAMPDGITALTTQELYNIYLEKNK